MKIVVFAKELFQAIGKHNVGMLAAAVSFFGFSAMVPLLLVLIFGATFFVEQGMVGHVLAIVLRILIPTLPSESNILGESIARLMELRSRMSLIALGSLLFTAIGGFVSFQQILDIIWGARSRRSFVMQYVVGFVMMSFFLLLTVVSSAITAIPHLLASDLHVHMNGFGWLLVMATVSQFAFPLLLFLTTYLSFRFLPSKPIQDRYLLAGAAISTVAIFVSRLLFSWYLGHLGQYQMIYGALTFVMLLLFWIYIVSNIVLISAEVIVCFSRFVANDSNRKSTDIKVEDR